MLVRHEAAQEMRVGPSKSAYRSRLQTASSCMGKVVSVEGKGTAKTVSGEVQGDERKRTTDEVSKTKVGAPIGSPLLPGPGGEIPPGYSTTNGKGVCSPEE